MGGAGLPASWGKAMAPQLWGLGTWNVRGIILGARVALLGAAEVGFGLLAVPFAGGRKQDPEKGKLKRAPSSHLSLKGMLLGGAGGPGALRELSTLAFRLSLASLEAAVSGSATVALWLIFPTHRAPPGSRPH